MNLPETLPGRVVVPQGDDLSRTAFMQFYILYRHFK